MAETIECADGRELDVEVHESGLWVTDVETGESWPMAATDILLAPESPFD